MNSAFSNYLLFEKEQFAPENLAGALTGYDRFVSAYNQSERVRTVFEAAKVPTKHWLNFRQYGIPASDIDSGTVVDCVSSDEDEVIRQYLDSFPLTSGEKICIDTTGFLRPHLLYLLALLYESGWDSADMLYSEPSSYQKGSSTTFSGDIKEVRQVRGFEGLHTPEAEGECLIVGCGYDSDLMAVVANHRVRARKVQMFPFPALRPHMYQENRLRTQECQEAFGAVFQTCFAPGFDPFATAHVLSHFYQHARATINNLYLAPLATKAQVIGFGLFYLMECLGKPVSIIFPFSDQYNRETSTGLSEVWKYHFDFGLLRSLRA